MDMENWNDTDLHPEADLYLTNGLSNHTGRNQNYWLPDSLNFSIDNLSSRFQNFRVSGAVSVDYSMRPRRMNDPFCIYEMQIIRDKIYFMTMDKIQCHYLQKKLVEQPFPFIRIIFDAAIHHIIEFSIHVYGNHLVQTLISVCNNEQRMIMLQIIVASRHILLEIASDNYGTLVLQRLIKTARRREIPILITALEEIFLSLAKDINGHHVLDRCLECLKYEDNEILLYAAIRNFMDVSTQRFGCCVMKNYVGYARGDCRRRLVTKVLLNGLFLTQNAFGNYVVQRVLELNDPFAKGMLSAQFRGRYVELSVQKHSSHVVEKCLRVFDGYNRRRIIQELLHTVNFYYLLQHEYANYVIQSALDVSEEINSFC